MTLCRSVQLSAAALLLSASTLAGCREPRSALPATSAAVSTTTASATTTTASATTTSTAEPDLITLRGTVQEGVERDCLLLDAGTGTVYLLLGGDRQALLSHPVVIVQGRPEPGLATTCQQGVPFTVTDVRPA